MPNLNNADAALIILPSGRVKVVETSNKSGQLGIGNLESCPDGRCEAVLSDVADVVDGAAGSDCYLVLRTDGTVLAWGLNSRGQLGLAAPGSKPEFGKIPKPVPQPTPIPGLTRVRQVAAGAGFSLALLEDGTVRAWGGNHEGQLGLGSSFPETLKQYAYAPYPLQIPGLSGVKAIAAAGGSTAHALALMEDGTVKAWGSNMHGLLGVEGIPRSDVPVTVPGIDKAVAISTSIEYSLALLADATVVVWGEGTLHGANFGGARGPSIHTEDARPWTATPLAIPGLRTVTAISAGINALALLADGTVRAWGYNGYYSMGLGHNTEYPKGIQTLKVSNIAAVAAGHNTSYFVQQDGTVLRSGLPRRVPTVILSKEEAATVR